MANPTIKITSGTTTTYLPLTTIRPTNTNCETALYVVHANDVASSSSLYQYGPLGPQKCLPDVANLWWQQSQVSTLITSIAPFTGCPAGYEAVYTSGGAADMGTSSTLTGCCPRSFTTERLVGPGTPSQCTSSISAGETLTYATNLGTVWSSITTLLSYDVLVRGVHVNGWNFYEPTITPSPSPDTTTTTDPLGGAPVAVETTSSTSVTGAAAAPTPQNGSSGLSASATAGVAVGVSLGVLGIAALLAALFFIRRHRAKKQASIALTDKPSDGGASAAGTSPRSEPGAWAQAVAKERMAEQPYRDDDMRERQKSLSVQGTMLSSVTAPPSYQRQELGGKPVLVEIGTSGERGLHEIG